MQLHAHAQAVRAAVHRLGTAGSGQARAARVKHHLMNTGLSRRLQAGWRPFAGTELLNKEIKRCAGVVGIFPNDAAITRLVGGSVARAAGGVAVGGLSRLL
jgi:hypothetical protein